MSERGLCLVPVRSLTSGKSRIAGALPDAARAELTRAMLAQVLLAVTDVDTFAPVVVVSPDPEALEVATALAPGIEPVRQPAERPGLLAAIEMGREAALAREAPFLLTVFGDLPTLQAADVKALLAGDADVVIAPDRRADGTNALLLRGRALSAFVFQFGAGSFRRHLAEAERLGLSTAIVERPGTAFDLDTPEDLALLPERLLDLVHVRVAP